MKEVRGILTDAEYNNLKKYSLNVSEPKTNYLMRYLDDLVVELESTEEHKKIIENTNAYIEEIKSNLPDHKKGLAMKLDDSYTELLVLYEEYFYKKGFIDGGRQKTFFGKFIGLFERFFKSFK